MKINTKYLAVGLLASCLVSGQAFAATQTVTANAAFDSALNVTPVNAINFGYLLAGTAATYTISPAGATSTTGGTYLGGTPQAGSYTVTGSGNQTISISAGTYTADRTVQISAATCNYAGSPVASCSGTGLAAPTAGGKPLLVGVTIAPTGAEADGSTYAPSFVLTITYT